MNDYQASDNCVAATKGFEGLRLTPYVDAAGHTTWGYGHKGRPGEMVPHSITEETADALLAADLMIAGSAVRRHVTIELTQAQFDGLTDFTFNLGEGNLECSSMLGFVNQGNWVTVDADGNKSGACHECERWVHAGGQVLPGLVARRAWDAEQMMPADAADTVWKPENEIKDAPLVFPPLDGAANIPTLTNEATPQQIEAAAMQQASLAQQAALAPVMMTPMPDAALAEHPISDPSTAPQAPAVP